MRKEHVLLFILIALSLHANAQIGMKMKIFVVPFSSSYRVALPKESVKKEAEMILNVKESMDTADFDQVLERLTSFEKDTILDQDARNYRIKCVIRKNIFRREVIYFNAFGDCCYRGKYYHSKKKLNIITGYLPEYLLFLK